MRVRSPRRRRGATLVEAAIVLGAFLTLVLGMLDLAVGVLRYHVVSEAARQGARLAIVHGALCLPDYDGGPWGPAPLDVAGTADNVPLVAALKRPNPPGFLTALDLTETRIHVEWPDGGNQPDQLVRVTVSTSYRPILTFLFGNPRFMLRATSTMPIAH